MMLMLLLLLLMWWSVARLVLGGHQLVPVGVPGVRLALGGQRRACNINTCLSRDHGYLPSHTKWARVSASPRVCFSELAANLKNGFTSSMVSRLSVELQEPGPCTPGPCLYTCRGNTGHDDVMML